MIASACAGPPILAPSMLDDLAELEQPFVAALAEPTHALQILGTAHQGAAEARASNRRVV
jgi:hypothetical protein